MIAVSAGHNNKAPGACFEEFCEFPEAVKWAELIVAALTQLRVEAEFVPTGSLGSKVRWINRKRADLAVEIHFNSDPKHAGKGCETLYCPGSRRGEIVAKVVHDGMAAIMLPDRGIKEGWYRMDKPGVVDYAGDVDGDEVKDYFLRSTRCPAIILEPEFIHNKSVITNKRDVTSIMIASGLARALVLCL